MLQNKKITYYIYLKLYVLQNTTGKAKQNDCSEQFKLAFGVRDIFAVSGDILRKSVSALKNKILPFAENQGIAIIKSVTLMIEFTMHIYMPTSLWQGSFLGYWLTIRRVLYPESYNLG